MRPNSLPNKHRLRSGPKQSNSLLQLLWAPRFSNHVAKPPKSGRKKQSATRLNNWFIWCPIGRNYNNRSVPDCWAARQQLNRQCPSGSLGVVGLRRSVSVKGVESSSSPSLPSVARWKRSPSRTQRQRGASERVRYNYVDSKRTPLISWKIKVSVYVPTSIERKFTMMYRVGLWLDTFWIVTRQTTELMKIIVNLNLWQ